VPSESLSSDFRRFQKRIVKDIEGCIEALTSILGSDSSNINDINTICSEQAAKLLHLKAVHADYYQREKKLINKIESRLVHPIEKMDHEVFYY
jgi:DNA-binding transcriptional regulator GbsR (MarR family)